MTPDDPRWVEVTPSQFTHEAEGLRLMGSSCPRHPLPGMVELRVPGLPRGAGDEVDLLVLGRGRLHLVELKYYRGLLSGGFQPTAGSAIGDAPRTPRSSWPTARPSAWRACCRTRCASGRGRTRTSPCPTPAT